MNRASVAKNIGVSWNNSLFMRITITFIAILIPLYMLGIFIYNSAKQSIQQETTSSMISQVTFYMTGLEKELYRIWNLEYDMINDEYLNRLSAIPESMNAIEKMQAMKNLQNRLEAIRSSSMYISNLTIYIPAIKRTLTDRGIDTMNENDYNVLIANYKPLSEIQYINDLPVILVESPYMDNDTGKPMYIFKLDLSSQTFSDALTQFDKYPGSGSFLINSETRKNIATANIKRQIEDEIIDRLKGAQQGELHAEDNDKAVRGMYIFTKSESLGMTLAMYVPQDVVVAPIKQYVSWFWIFTMAAAIVIAVYSFSMYRFIHKPLMQLVNAFEKVEEGNLEITIEHHHNDEFRYLYRRFNAMVVNLSNLINQVYTMKILTQKAELKQLQSQINPHFLYNSFFILHRRIKGGDYDNAITFSQQLGNYFRFITRNADDEVQLIREVEHARIYTDIQHIRFSSRISVDFEELPENADNIMVPRLILQPIIENAFEHGLENKVGGGQLHIGFELTPGKLSITVEDNGDSLEDAELARLQSVLSEQNSLAESTGIINIHRRIQLRFGADYGIQVSRSALGGFKVELNINAGGGEGNV